MKEYKENTSAEDYCEGNSKYLTPVLEYAYSLSFEERPDYNQICFMLKKVLLDLEQMPC